MVMRLSIELTNHTSQVLRTIDVGGGLASEFTIRLVHVEAHLSVLLALKTK